jgi:hypothetical protein
VSQRQAGPSASSSGGSVSASVLLSYSPPVAGLSGPLFIVQFYFLNFATDVLLLAPLSVGLFQTMRFRRFATRGRANIRGEWDLVCAGANALTLYRAEMA